MNLYDKDDGFKTFSVAEANDLLPEIVRITQDAINLLAKADSHFDAQNIGKTEDKNQQVTGKILENWAKEIVQLNVYPKGYFTVDFKSQIPGTLLCWTFGEETITHTHKINETFAERMAIQDDQVLGFEESMN